MKKSPPLVALPAGVATERRPDVAFGGTLVPRLVAAAEVTGPRVR
jgi:hypothetical protein